jgi:hypothetical protein
MFMMNIAIVSYPSELGLECVNIFTGKDVKLSSAQELDIINTTQKVIVKNNMAQLTFRNLIVQEDYFSRQEELTTIRDKIEIFATQLREHKSMATISSLASELVRVFTGWLDHTLEEQRVTFLVFLYLQEISKRLKKEECPSAITKQVTVIEDDLKTFLQSLNKHLFIYRGAMAGIIVFTKKDKESFNCAQDFLTEYSQYAGNKNVALIGVNEEPVEVTTSEGQSVAKLLGINYIELENNDQKEILIRKFIRELVIPFIDRFQVSYDPMAISRADSSVTLKAVFLTNKT